MKVNKIIIILVMLSSITFGQVTADLTIENQEVVGTDFFFDIYLTEQELMIYIWEMQIL